MLVQQLHSHAAAACSCSCYMLLQLLHAPAATTCSCSCYTDAYAVSKDSLQYHTCLKINLVHNLQIWTSAVAYIFSPLNALMPCDCQEVIQGDVLKEWWALIRRIDQSAKGRALGAGPVSSTRPHHNRTATVIWLRKHGSWYVSYFCCRQGDASKQYRTTWFVSTLNLYYHWLLIDFIFFLYNHGQEECRNLSQTLELFT